MSNGIKKLLSTALACGAFGGSMAGFPNAVFANETPPVTNAQKNQTVKPEKVRPMGGNWVVVQTIPPCPIEGTNKIIRGFFNNDWLNALAIAADGKLPGKRIDKKLYEKIMKKLFPSPESRSFIIDLKANILEKGYKKEIRGFSDTPVPKKFAAMRSTEYNAIVDEDVLETFNMNMPKILKEISDLFAMKSEFKNTSSSEVLLLFESFCKKAEELDALLRLLPNKTERTVREHLRPKFFDSLDNNWFTEITKEADFKLLPKSARSYSSWLENYLTRWEERMAGLELVIGGGKKEKNKK